MLRGQSVALFVVLIALIVCVAKVAAQPAPLLVRGCLLTQTGKQLRQSVAVEIDPPFRAPTVVHTDSRGCFAVRLPLSRTLQVDAKRNGGWINFTLVAMDSRYRVWFFGFPRTWRNGQWFTRYNGNAASAPRVFLRPAA